MFLKSVLHCFCGLLFVKTVEYFVISKMHGCSNNCSLEAVEFLLRKKGIFLI